jgi:hypothetical protein
LIPRGRVLVNWPPLLLPLPRDQLVSMPVNVRVRSFPATIRETSSRPNRHLCHRGSHNDDDHGCKIIRFPATFHSPSKNRSEAAARAFHSAFHDSVQGREAAPAATGAPLGDFHQGVILTPRWREMDSNPRSPMRKTARKRRSRSLTKRQVRKGRTGQFPQSIHIWQASNGGAHPEFGGQRVRRFRGRRHPSPHGPTARFGTGHAAWNRTSSARAVPTSSIKSASATPSLRK